MLPNRGDNSREDADRRDHATNLQSGQSLGLRRIHNPRCQANRREDCSNEGGIP